MAMVAAAEDKVENLVMGGWQQIAVRRSIIDLFRMIENCLRADLMRTQSRKEEH